MKTKPLTSWEEVQSIFDKKMTRSKKKKCPFAARELIKRRTSSRVNRTLQKLVEQNSHEELAQIAYLSWKAILKEQETGIPHNLAHLVPPSVAKQKGIKDFANVGNFVVIPAGVNAIMKQRPFTKSSAMKLSKEYMSALKPVLPAIQSSLKD